MFNPKQALGNKHHESCAFVPLGCGMPAGWLAVPWVAARRQHFSNGDTENADFESFILLACEMGLNELTLGLGTTIVHQVS